MTSADCSFILKIFANPYGLGLHVLQQKGLDYPLYAQSAPEVKDGEGNLSGHIVWSGFPGDETAEGLLR